MPFAPTWHGTPPRWHVTFLLPAFVVTVALAAAACAGGQTARIPPLPPAPHPAMQGPSITKVQRAGVLHVASDLSYPPMEFRDGGVARGFEVDLAVLLASALSVHLEVADTPFAVMRAEFPRGVDLLVSALPVDRTPGIPSVPYYVSGQAVLWPEGAPVRTPEALRDVRVAVTAGTPGETLVAEARTRVVTYLQEQALWAVVDGRAQAAVGDRPVLLGFSQVHPHLGVTSGRSQEVPLVAVARPDAPDLAAFVSAAIRELQRNGGLELLRRRWHL